MGPYVIVGKDPEKPRADLQRPWKMISKRAGLLGVRIHDLRHTHASVGVGAGFGLPIIGKLLGHTQASTTQRYPAAQSGGEPASVVMRTLGHGSARFWALPFASTAECEMYSRSRARDMPT